VESIVNCNSFGGGTFERGGSSYANQSTVEQVDNERWKCRHVYRKTVASALLQIVLVSRPLLQHIGANANDPLGKLLHPMRVIGLMLGVDESTDINELHMSGIRSSCLLFQHSLTLCHSNSPLHVQVLAKDHHGGSGSGLHRPIHQIVIVDPAAIAACAAPQSCSLQDNAQETATGKHFLC
jgi:hypothetical protein